MNKNTDIITIGIRRIRLSDNSHSYDVGVTQWFPNSEDRPADRIEYMACSEADAFEFAKKLKTAIEEHTITPVDELSTDY